MSTHGLARGGKFEICDQPSSRDGSGDDVNRTEAEVGSSGKKVAVIGIDFFEACFGSGSDATSKRS